MFVKKLTLWQIWSLFPCPSLKVGSGEESVESESHSQLWSTCSYGLFALFYEDCWEANPKVKTLYLMSSNCFLPPSIFSLFSLLYMIIPFPFKHKCDEHDLTLNDVLIFRVYELVMGLQDPCPIPRTGSSQWVFIQLSFQHLLLQPIGGSTLSQMVAPNLQVRLFRTDI